MTAMAITPDEIETKVFPLVRRGYEPAAVDDFLKDVATTLAQAQGGLATPPVPEAEATAPEPVAEPAAEPDAVTVRGPDDFGQLGEEVAAILRQAHESVAQLRHRAEADAALQVHHNEHEGKIGVLCLAPEEGLGIDDPEFREKVGEDKITLFRRHGDKA